ncbi:TonB-dependent receptor SusC [termite gut metagenome]|uniref:TonB-dependent receptor SusC n=1 Tax=termite gut metagenome TaxID=433724 RepID=A0A5J4SGF8_9ZZZZ
MKTLFSVFLFVFFAQWIYAQETWQIFGVVADVENEDPLSGVSVSVEGLSLGTVTDFDGKFSLTVPKGKSIVFSYVGYKTQTIVLKNNNLLIVKMEYESFMLDEVVAIGYGSIKKSDLTGAVTSVKIDQLQKTPASGIDQALQGRAAGVTVNANSGQPGAAAEVRIRGIGTVNDSRPIYVVDGVIVENISFLSPNDISSTEILKDASATAIYGSRGANGVILVSTLKGKEGKTTISFNSYVGFQNRWKKLDLMKRDEFSLTLLKINPQASSIALYQQEGFNAWMKNNTGNSPNFPLLKTAANPYGMDYASVETDWQDEVFNSNAVIQNYYLSMSGGNEKNNYAVSASYFNQDGTIIGSNYERLTLRINSTHQIHSWLKVGENLSFVNSTGRNAMNNSSSPGASVLSAAIAMAPWDPTHYPDGAINNKGKDLSGQISAASNFKNVTNPFSMVENNHPQDIAERWVGDLYLDIMPIKNLTWHPSVSMDLSNNRSRSFGDAYRYSDYDHRDRNFLSSDMRRYRTLTFENIITYTLGINKHSLSLMGGQTTEQYDYYTIGGAGASILNPSENNWYLSKTTEEKTLSNDGVDRSRRASFLGRFHYSYNDRYLLTANFRADGSSKFRENTWGYFPSVALAWRITEEKWMKDIQNLDFLKLRLGWGQIGNDKISDNSFVLNMSEGMNVFTGYPFGVNQDLVNGAAILSYINKGGKWETTEQWNIGIDFGIYKKFLVGSFDAFVRDTKDMILSVKAPAQVGNRFDSSKNVGTVRNQGIELTLDHQNKINGINYSINGNVSFIKNELIALNEGSPVYGDKVLSNEGLPLFTIWGYEHEGIYKTEKEILEHLWSYGTIGESGIHVGDAKYRDLSGSNGMPDGKIDDYDKTNLGNPFPWLTYGLNIGADYKGFDLQIFFQGIYGNKLYNDVRHRTEGAGNDATLSTTMKNVWIDYTDVIKASMESRNIDWHALINPDGTIPNPIGNPMNNKVVTSRMVESGAYLRLKNLQLGYTIPKKITEKWNIERCRFYVSGSNLLTITGYSGYDPEIGSGIDYGNYPQSRTILFGLNLSF